MANKSFYIFMTTIISLFIFFFFTLIGESIMPLRHHSYAGIIIGISIGILWGFIASVTLIARKVINGLPKKTLFAILGGAVFYVVLWVSFNNTTLNLIYLVSKYDPARNSFKDLEEAIAKAKSNERILLVVGKEESNWCRGLDNYIKRFIQP